jgi:hypothetical protein
MVLLNIFSRCNGPFNINDIIVESVEVKCDVCHESYVMTYDKLNVESKEGIVTAVLPCGHPTIFIHETFMDPALRSAFKEARKTEDQRKAEAADKRRKYDAKRAAMKNAHADHIQRHERCCRNCANLRHVIAPDNEDYGSVNAPVCIYDFPKIAASKWDEDDYELDIEVERSKCVNFMYIYRCYNCHKIIGDEPSPYGFIPKHPDYGFDMDAEYICKSCKDYLPSAKNKGTVVPLSWTVHNEFEDDEEDTL